MNKRDSQFHEVLNNAIKIGAFPGCSYAIVTNEETHYGVLGNKALVPVVEKNTDDVMYDLASLSKVIGTTTAIMLLREKGLLKLSDYVKDYLPCFPHEDIQIFDLLIHASGLPADIPRAYTLKSKKDVIDKIINSELLYKKFDMIIYSDIGFITLALIVEKITDQTLDVFLKENLFDPLEMNDTMYNPLDIQRCAPTQERNDDVYKGMLRGKVHDEKAFALDGVAGHAGMFSTHRDIANFIKMILDKGVFKGKRILEESTVDLLFKKQLTAKNKQGTVVCRTIGWDTVSIPSSSGNYTSSKTILHTGFTGNNLFIDPVNQIGFVLLSNRVHPSRDNLKIKKQREVIADFVMKKYAN